MIDRMVSSGLQTVTGCSSDSAAWSALFHFHNRNAGKGDVGYTSGEKVFIKINATSAWAGNFNVSDLSKVENSWYGISETSPQVVLSALRQLVYAAKVPQSNILVGDPLRHIYKHCYDLWSPEFPNVHYLDHDGYAGREAVIPSQTAIVHYSDRGTILHTSTGAPTVEDHLYTVFEDAAYLVDIPMLKGHTYAGMTAFAKNHFGSQTRADASHLHNGLVSPPSPDVLRTGYGLYRVQVDLMSHHLLGGKNLVFLMDALWSTDYELDNPVKWRMPPFNNDWMSSMFFSLDEVAIESVGYDFLRSEFTAQRGLATYVQQVGVDDYLHQAADSSTWPAGMIYDPDSTGVPISSQGVHEHWNNMTDMQYTRNLGTGTGIELIRLPQSANAIVSPPAASRTMRLLPNYPNPFNPSTTITFELQKGARVSLQVIDLQGRLVATLVDGFRAPGTYSASFNGTGFASGMYFYRLQADSYVSTRKMVLLR
ncbi:MAG TPA: T9SS type A sorting domain-containing protein [Bacteroidota bacterium]|nr:T9SS type A sorting domain-containing protein [Bacteroidota bacterium]